MYRAMLWKSRRKNRRGNIGPGRDNLHIGEAEIEDVDLPFKVRIFKGSGGKSETIQMETGRPYSHSHKVIIPKIIITLVVGVIDMGVAASIQRDLGLRRLGLLIALVSSTLLTHLLIGSSSESTSNLLDLSTGQLLHKLAGEVLRPERVVSLLGVRGEERHKGLGQAGELVLGDGLEQWHGGQIDGLCGVG